MAGLVVADELSESLAKVDELEGVIANLRETQGSLSERGDDAGDVLADVLDKASKRVEEIVVQLERA